MSERFLIPREGLHVVDPATMAALPAEGAIVRGNAEYWMRRLNDGDVTEQAPQTEPTRRRSAVSLNAAAKE